MKKKLSIPPLGQTLVEFALILPVFIFLVVVIFDFGRAVYYYNAIHNAAREGARHGSVFPTDTVGMKTVAVNYAVGLGLQLNDVSAEWNPVGNIGMNTIYEVTVNVNYCFEPVTPFVQALINSGCSICPCSKLLLSSESVMRTEVVPEP